MGLRFEGLSFLTTKRLCFVFFYAFVVSRIFDIWVLWERIELEILNSDCKGQNFTK